MLFSERLPIFVSCMTILEEEPNNRFCGMSLALRVIFSGGKTEQCVIIAGFGELAAVDLNT